MADLDTSSLIAPAREAARFVWQRRYLGESGSVELARRLRALVAETGGLGVEIDEALARLERDEREHVDLVARVLAQLGEPSPQYRAPPPVTGPPREVLARLVLAGLCVSESIAAARFRAVRVRTDISVARACIELFLRDEIVHAELGFLLFPIVAEGVDAPMLQATLVRAFRHFEREVARDAGLTTPLSSAGATPAGNPGVVGPDVDAIAFYDAIAELCPRLDALGLRATEAWNARRRDVVRRVQRGQGNK